MKRMRIVGLCLLAVFAFSAIAASAQASPEMGSCVKLAKAKGKYANAGCTELFLKKGKPASKGAYEWTPGAPPSCIAQKKGEYTDAACTTKSVKAHKGGFEKEPGPGFTAAGGTATLKTPAFGAPVVCAKSTGTGQITGITTVEEQFTFEGCETSAKKCTSAGETSGKIQTPVLAGTLSSPKAGEASTAFESKTGPSGLSSEFNCEGPQIRTFGYVSGEDFPLNVTSTTGSEKFENGLGEQDLQTELNAGSGWLGPAPSLEETSGSNTYATAVEIRL
jgi:hypothetical protein